VLLHGDVEHVSGHDGTSSACVQVTTATTAGPLSL
jgi:hypothetical protein